MWFDYIALSDDERRILFAKEYAQVYRNHHARRNCINEAPYICPLPGLKSGPFTGKGREKRWDGKKYWTIDTVPESRWNYDSLRESRVTWGALGKAVKAADSISVPYGFYCNAVIEVRTKSCWTYIPKVFHLYAPEIIAEVQAAWDEHKGNHAPLPSPERISEYAGPQFIAYLKDLVDRMFRPIYLIRQLIDRQYLLPATCVLLFGERLTDGALRAY